MNRLILGDNLEVMKKMESESIDLIYLDPPFFSNRHYEVIWGDKGEIRSFEDRWAGGIEHYIEWLKDRIQEMHRLLKSTGSIFVHCDWRASAYIRVHILDKLFLKNFVNEIIWCFSQGGKSKNTFARKHNTIFWYSKSKKYFIDFKDVKIGYTPHKGDKSGKNYGGRMGQDEDGRIYVEKWGTGKKKLYRYYLDDGKIPEDVWTEFQSIQSAAEERLGYPTQKPEPLLMRIIQCASKEGDIVLDPFVGGGTTVAVADKLNRQWIGIDQSPIAVRVSEARLNNQLGLLQKPFEVLLHKYDYKTLRYKEPFEFESWIVQQYGGIPNIKQRGELGIDGKTGDTKIPIQVKRSDNVGRAVIDHFKSACERFDLSLFNKNKKQGNPVGVLIAFSFGKGTYEEVSRLKNDEGVIIKLIKVEDIVPISKGSSLSVEIEDGGFNEKGLREIKLTANAESESEIVAYQWDWNYNEEKKVFQPEVYTDKTGTQTIQLKPGTHIIAVRAVDTDGLESEEVIKLQINGGIKRNS